MDQLLRRVIALKPPLSPKHALDCRVSFEIELPTNDFERLAGDGFGQIECHITPHLMFCRPLF